MEEQEEDMGPEIVGVDPELRDAQKKGNKIR